MRCETNRHLRHPTNDTRNFAALFGGGEPKMSSTPKAVTPFGGMVSFFAWLVAIGYGARITAEMPFCYQSPNAIPLEHTLTAFLSSMLVGASRFAHAGWSVVCAATRCLRNVSCHPRWWTSRDRVRQTERENHRVTRHRRGRIDRHGSASYRGNAGYLHGFHLCLKDRGTGLGDSERPTSRAAGLIAVAHGSRFEGTRAGSQRKRAAVESPKRILRRIEAVFDG